MSSRRCLSGGRRIQRHRLPFRGWRSRRLDRTAARRGAIETLLAASPATPGDLEEAERLIGRLPDADAAELPEMVGRLRTLGPATAPLIDAHLRQQRDGTSPLLAKLIDGWAWRAAQDAFAARLGWHPTAPRGE